MEFKVKSVTEDEFAVIEAIVISVACFVIPKLSKSPFNKIVLSAGAAVTKLIESVKLSAFAVAVKPNVATVTESVSAIAAVSNVKIILPVFCHLLRVVAAKT